MRTKTLWIIGILAAIAAVAYYLYSQNSGSGGGTVGVGSLGQYYDNLLSDSSAILGQSSG
jgi:hypothetical protein